MKKYLTPGNLIEDWEVEIVFVPNGKEEAGVPVDQNKNIQDNLNKCIY